MNCTMSNAKKIGYNCLMNVLRSYSFICLPAIRDYPHLPNLKLSGIVVDLRMISVGDCTVGTCSFVTPRISTG